MFSRKDYHKITNKHLLAKSFSKNMLGQVTLLSLLIVSILFSSAYVSLFFFFFFLLGAFYFLTLLLDLVPLQLIINHVKVNDIIIF